MAGVGTTRETLQHIRDILIPGMTDNQEDAPWFIKTWLINRPIGYEVVDLPLGILASEGPSRRPQYVQEDTQVFDITLHLFSKPVYEMRSPEGVNLVENANIEVEAMIDRATDLIREDPSLGGEFYDCMVSGTVPRQPGWLGNATYPGAEIKLQALRRRPWNAASLVP